MRERSLPASRSRSDSSRVAGLTNGSHLEIMRAIRYRDVDKELAQFFRQLLIDRDIYRGIACLDRSGTIVAAAGDTGGIAMDDSPRETRAVLTPEGGAPT